MLEEDFFPEIITNLPEADIPFEGVRSHLFQGENQQFVFMSFENDLEVPKHSHEAQWGVVLDGEIELTIGSSNRTFSKGHTYFIPKDVRHSARIRKGYKDLSLFDQKDRYRAKQNPPYASS
jgi:quercetin dioxygenase-like cupin family protein